MSEPSDIPASDQHSVHTNLRRKWRRWLTRIEDELTRLVISREIFTGVRDIVLPNPKIQNPSDFHDWLIHNYFATTSVAIRRLTDEDSRSVSLTRFLKDLEKHSAAVTRLSHVCRYPAWIKEAGNTCFDHLAGRGRQSLDPAIPHGDLEQIRDAEKRIRRFVNKRIAHLDKRNRRFRPQQFNELDSVIGVLERMFLKYKLLLTARDATTLVPTWTYEWRSIFREPWIRDS